MRVFYALWPGPEPKARIAEAAAALSLGSAARPVPQESYHLTLAFVGEVSPARLAVLQQTGRDLSVAGCTIRFDAYEYWPEAHAVVALARKVAQAPVLQAMSPFHWKATSFSLVRSDTGGAHSVYTVLDTWPLLYESPIP